MAEAFAFVGDTLIMHLIMLFVWFVAYGLLRRPLRLLRKIDIASLHSFALFRVQPSASLKTLAEELDEAVRETVRGWRTTDRFFARRVHPPRNLLTPPAAARFIFCHG